MANALTRASGDGRTRFPHLHPFKKNSLRARPLTSRSYPPLHQTSTPDSTAPLACTAAYVAMARLAARAGARTGVLTRLAQVLIQVAEQVIALGAHRQAPYAIADLRASVELRD
jgi:hypothetical protein